MSLASDLRDNLIGVIVLADGVSADIKGLPAGLQGRIVELKAAVIAVRSLAFQSQILTAAMLGPEPFGPDHENAPEELHVQCVSARPRVRLCGKDLAAGEHEEVGA